MLQLIRYLLNRSLCFQPERELAGSEFHRRINRAFARHTQQLGGKPDPPLGDRAFELVVCGILASGIACGRRDEGVRSAQLNGLDPHAYMKDVLQRLPTQRASAIGDLLPHRWKPSTAD